MKDITVWNKIVAQFGFRAPNSDNKKGFADIIMPLEEDVVILEEKEIDAIVVPEGLTVHNLFDKDKKTEYLQLVSDWQEYYREVVQEGKQRLQFTEQNINKDGKRVHKILLLQGIDDSARKYYGSNFGGLVYNAGIKEDSTGKVRVDFGTNLMDTRTQEGLRLFSYGLEEGNTHILTEQQLTFISSYIPTLRGIVDYLCWKEFLFSTTEIMSIDEYTLLILYFLEIFKGRKQSNVLVPFEDKQIADFIESELSHKLLTSSSVFQEFVEYVRENEDFTSHYFLFNLKSLLMFTDNLPDIIYTDYTQHSSKTFMLYQGTNLYVFHNADERIKEDRVRTVYGGHLISKIALQYLDELKSDIDIQNIICSVMHKDIDDRLYTTFIAIDLNNLKDENSLNEIKSFAAEGESLEWLPKTISLGQLLEQKRSEVKASIPEQKGTDRNKPCPCGSGTKYKKCCGKY